MTVSVGAEPGAGDRAVICLSGGMDSTSLMLHLLARRCQVYGVSFDYGQRHRLELDRLQANLQYLTARGHDVHHRCLDLSDLRHLLSSALTQHERGVPLGHYAEANMKETVVPNRNAIFASIAFGYALSLAQSNSQPVWLSLGVHSGDHAIYPDCRPRFYLELIQAFRTGNWEADRVVLYLPYLQWDKATILKDATKSTSKLNLEFETVMRNTCTSYQPDDQGRAHGLTGSDVERILAFDSLGLVDPLPYARPWSELVAEAKKLHANVRANNA